MAKRKATERKRGRPPLRPKQRKRNNVTIRFRDDLKSKVQKAGEDNGRSLSEEIEARLEQSFVGDDVIHHMLGFDLSSMMALRGLADAIAQIERRAGKSWREDWIAREQVGAAFEAILEIFGPQDPAENRLTPQGRARVEKRALRNQIAGRNAALSSVKALMPGLKAMQRRLDEARALEEAPDKENVET